MNLVSWESQFHPKYLGGWGIKHIGTFAIVLPDKGSWNMIIKKGIVSSKNNYET